MGAERLNIVGVIFSETAVFSGKSALVENQRALTYGDLADAVRRVAVELSRHGVRPLDRVAFLCPDGIDYVVVTLAILSLDAAVVPIAPGLMADERRTLPERMNVRHILMDATFQEAGKGCPLNRMKGVERAFALTSRGHAAESLPTGYADIRPAFIRFSSGTTGESKGVILSHETILARTDAADAGLRVTAADTVGWVLSMSFHFVVTILLFLRRGATIVLCGEPMPEGLANALMRHRLTLLYASPLHYRMLAAAAGLTPLHFSFVRMAVSTAVKLPEAIARATEERFGIRLTEAYGIIEVGLPFVHCRSADEPDGTLGQPLPAYEIQIGNDCEILIRGEGLFDAYLAPWRTRAACCPDGWFHTGDTGEWLPGGALRLSGRVKTVINFSGMKIFPQEIEDVLNAHPAIAESQAYGEPHAEYGQIPCAWLVLKPTAKPPGTTALRAFCCERLAKHKVPKIFTVTHALKKTASGKLVRV